VDIPIGQYECTVISRLFQRIIATSLGIVGSSLQNSEFLVQVAMQEGKQ
jgi:hypothetical protein